ncbi:MAG TPA: acyl-CoA dehydrogenase family protein [Acidimicrobiales bacterium]|jgi:alkylation response protein AidB-like acyl-CoA dehydrogenase|nr:acyl-CoA dehydrogenase family protein [Acidimicrobiales bacterium]
MDFSLSEEQAAVVEAALKLFEGHLSDDRRAEVAAAGEGFDRKLWAALADANLLGLAISEKFGGTGLGFAELSVLLEEAGRAAVPVPLWATLVLGALPIEEFGSDEQKERLLGPIAKGDLIVTAALSEVGTEPEAPLTTARRLDGGWLLDGTKTCVSAGTVAGHLLVPARVGEEVAVFIVPAHAEGVKVTTQMITTDVPDAHIEFNGVEVGDADVLGDASSGAAIVEWIRLRATSALCSLMAGTCQAALKLTAEYAVTRKQFDRAIATFQAVGQRAADAYVDTEAVGITARQAAWRISAGLPAEAHVAIAKFWAADGGQRAVHAAQHIHGGLGVDRSYPLHRYFLAAKHIELTLGGATPNLLRLGAIMAAETV